MQLPRPSSCGTFHITKTGERIYSNKFDWVLPFHNPGLAPVGDASGSYHIDLKGMPLYAERYQRTFGYYDGLASVVMDDKWFHIDENGKIVFGKDWDWAGNFQSGFCVVRKDSKMFHINKQGNVLNDSGWTYAGDFRDKISVVRDNDGFYRHINDNGDFAHDMQFQQLGVYHKGFAVAKDEEGWFHIDINGNQIYPFRFQELEPFYNGIAKAVMLDGIEVLIDEKGKITPIENQRTFQSEDYSTLPKQINTESEFLNELNLRKEMTFICRHMYKMGYNFTIDGNISHRINNEQMMISPSGQHLGFITPEDFILIGMNGKPLSSDRKPSSEWKLHKEIYQIRPDINCIIHAHPPSAIAASVANIDLSKVFAHYSPIPTTEFAVNCTDEVVEVLAPFIEKENWAILKRHGVVTWANNLTNTFLRLEGLEQCAKIVTMASSITEIEPMSKDNIRKLFNMWGLDYENYSMGDL